MRSFLLFCCAMASSANAQQQQAAVDLTAGALLEPLIQSSQQPEKPQQAQQQIRQRSTTAHTLESPSEISASAGAASSSLSSSTLLSAKQEAAAAAEAVDACRQQFLVNSLREMEIRLEARHEQAWNEFRAEQASIAVALASVEANVVKMWDAVVALPKENPEMSSERSSQQQQESRHLLQFNTTSAIQQLQKRVLALEQRLHRLETGVVSSVQNRVLTLEGDVDELARVVSETASQQQQATFCGCASCTTSAWNAMAPANTDPNFTCGSRITYLQKSGMSNLDACRTVARDQHPAECSACNPDTCNGGGGGTTGTAGNTASVPATATVRTPAPTLPPHPPLTATTPMYCFPNYNVRKRFTGVFNQGFIVETKEGMCGPGNNLFTRRTVSRTPGGGIKLQYKKNGSAWEASEVRIVLPTNQMPFSYGTYKFSVKRVSTIDSTTGKAVSSKLSKDLVLGMFTWDTTDNYDVHENMNHEVDVEISQWGIDNNADVQFVAQPPEQPHYHRFFSGAGNTYSPGGKTYEFTWNPTSITWKSSSGASHTYTTQQALASGLVDYVQCLPANLEIRINIWNKNGAVAPAGMTDQQVAEVVIDNFTYTPSNVKGVANGKACSKHCQCLGASRCVNNVCTAA